MSQMTGCHSPQCPDLAWKNRAGFTRTIISGTSWEQTNASKGKHRTNCYIDACYVKTFYFLSSYVHFQFQRRGRRAIFCWETQSKSFRKINFYLGRVPKAIREPLMWPSIAPAWGKLQEHQGAAWRRNSLEKWLLVRSHSLAGDQSVGESSEGRTCFRKLAIPAVAESAMEQKGFFWRGQRQNLLSLLPKIFTIHRDIVRQMGFKWNIWSAKNKRKRNETESPLQMERGEIFHVSKTLKTDFPPWNRMYPYN